MHVIAVAQSDIHLALQYSGRAGKILRSGHFDIVLVARDRCDLQARGKGHFDVVGGRGRCGLVGGDDALKVKALWRLRPHETGAVLDGGDVACLRDPQGIGDRQGGGCGWSTVKCCYDCVDRVAADAGAGHIVDQHQIRRVILQGRKPGLN